MPGRSAEYFTASKSTSIEWIRLIPKNVYYMLLLCTSILNQFFLQNKVDTVEMVNEKDHSNFCNIIAVDNSASEQHNFLCPVLKIDQLELTHFDALDQQDG